MTIRRLGIAGDSLSSGAVHQHSTEFGGAGSWAQQLGEYLGNISGVGPLLSAGSRWFSTILTTGTEWSFTSGSWTQIPASTSDKVPYEQGYFTTGNSASVVTYDYPSRWRPCLGMTIFFVDTPTLTSMQFRFNGTTSWLDLVTAEPTGIGFTPLNDTKVKCFYISASHLSLTSITKLEVRGGPGGGSKMPVAVEPWFVDASTNPSGVIIDNYASPGRQLHELTPTASGADRMAVFDSVTRLTYNGFQAPDNRPTVGMLMQHINDGKVNDLTIWDTDLRTFYARVSPLCPVAFWNTWEVSPVLATTPVQVGIDTTIQANYRTQLKTTAAAVGAQVFDMKDALDGRGIVGNAATYTAGLLDVDHTHEAAYGHQLAYEYLKDYVRKTFFPASAPSVTPTWKLNEQQLLNGTDRGGTPGPLGAVAAFQAGAVRASGESAYA